MNRRIEALEHLLKFDKSIANLQSDLSEFSWDYDGQALVLSASQVNTILEQFVAGQHTEQEIEDWANLIECREDLEYEKPKSQEIEMVIQRLANPDIEGKITTEVCVELINSLE